MKQKLFLRQLLMGGILVLLTPFVVHAQNSSSSNYQVYEAQFGSGGIEEQCSGNEFCAQGSLGANAVGRQSSDNFDAEAGVLTQNEEFLEFVILSSSVNLGEITPQTTGVGSVEFYIRSYLSSGYTVFNDADPLSLPGGESLDPLSTGGASTPGVEQFGMNLVDNSNPDVGANFINVPDDSFADGGIVAGYDVPDQFRYNNGEAFIVAPNSPGRQGTGQTEYTISYIANVSTLTPAGTYLMNHNLIVVPTY